MERKEIVKPITNSPFSAEISGSDGAKLVKVKYEYRDTKEIAVIDWRWSVPPKTLLPGSSFEMTQTYTVKEWRMKHYISGQMGTFFQKAGACVCEGGADLGTLSFDYDIVDLTGRSKTERKSSKIPDYGDLDSAISNRFQITVNLNQNGANYQWSYIYQWKGSSVSPKIEIELQIGAKQAKVNGIPRILDAPPYLFNNRSLVPFRFLGEVFGAQISYTVNPSTKKVDKIMYKTGNLTIELYVNRQEAWVNRKMILLDVTPQVKAGRTFVPLRFISEHLLAEVTWNPGLQKITIKKG